MTNNHQLFQAGIVPATQDQFVGRLEELQIMKTALINNTQQVVNVTGEYGIGKTSLVHQFVHMFESDFPGGVTTIYPIRDIPIIDRLPPKKLDTKKRSLLVLEEAEGLKPNALSGLGDMLMANPNMKCIIVSRTKLAVPVSSWINVHLGTFSLSSWAELLEKRLGEYDESKAERYFYYTSGHPLVLSWGAATIREGLQSWEELLRNIQPFEEPGIIGPDGIAYDTSIALPKPIVTVSEYLEERLFNEVVRNPDLMYTLSPRDFERFLAECLNKLGYEITLTPPGKDGGVDIYAARSDEFGRFLFLVECKRYAKIIKYKLTL